MHLTAEIRYPADITTVGAMLADADYVATKVRESGALSQQVDVVRTGTDGFTVTTRRQMPTDDIPPQFRSLVGSTLEIRQVEAWGAQDDDERHGTLVIEIPGVPVRVTGTARLVAQPDGTTVEHLAGDVRASLPLFGPAIEQATAGAVEAAVAAEERSAAAWLAR